ncbi:MAG: FtsQ-type POTRA domain-containing protein [Gemmatimonadetes bacterium]|nr:FtsQ-type POTRA domain-containing protein [Gemmatimonadota bacterium]
MTRRRLLVVAGAAVGVATLAVALRPILRHVDWFRVRRVEVVGAVYLDPNEIARAMQLKSRASIFDDLTPARDRVLAMPGVRNVTVDWRLPGALVVEVTEFEPVALTQAQGRLALVDRRGRVLPFDPTRSATDLPVATGDPAVTALLDRIRDVDSDLFGQVVSATRERGTVVVETATERILFRPGADAKDLNALRVVRSEVRRRGMAVAELDARFEKRIVVRGRRS